MIVEGFLFRPKDIVFPNCSFYLFGKELSSKGPQSLLELSSLPNLHTGIHTQNDTSFSRVRWSLSPRRGVRQCGRDTSPWRQYVFGTPWPTVPSETPPLSCMCQQKQKPLCQAAIPSTLPSLWSPPSIPRSVQSQEQQVNPNCMLIRALRTSL